MDLWLHQREAVEWCRGRKCCILHMGMGTGKTRSLLEVLREESLSRVLVCCPKAVMPAWQKQAALWLGEHRVVVLDDATSKKKGESAKAALADSSPVIIVCNYESAWRIKELEQAPWDCLVYDECHRLKAPSGTASRWAARMGKRHKEAKRVGLSGTLLAHSPLDAYGVYRAIESPDCGTFGQSYTAFRARYSISRPGYPGWVVGYRNVDEFGTKVAQSTFHRKSEDVLDLPEIMHEQVDVTLSPKESAAYAGLEDDFCVTVGNENVTASNVLVKLLRLMEICGGHVRADGAAASAAIDDRPSKAAAFDDILDAVGDEPVVVFHRFVADGEACATVCGAAKKSWSVLNGRKNELEDWQAGKTQVLIANIASGGIGIDLTRASYGIFYSLSHSLSDYLQAVARLHRPGQSRTTHFYSLVARHGRKMTVDGHVYKALQERREVIDAIIGGYRGTQSVVGSC